MSTQRGRPARIAPALRERIVGLHRDLGYSARSIAAILEAAAVPAPDGGTAWHASTITRLLDRQGLPRLRRGRPSRRRLVPDAPRNTPLHTVTAIAYRHRAQGSGSDLWGLLESEGKLTAEREL